MNYFITRIFLLFAAIGLLKTTPIFEAIGNSNILLASIVLIFAFLLYFPDSILLMTKDAGWKRRFKSDFHELIWHKRHTLNNIGKL